MIPNMKAKFIPRGTNTKPPGIHFGARAVPARSAGPTKQALGRCHVPPNAKRCGRGTFRAPLAAALLLCVLALIPLTLCAATNDLTGLLQKGLFEEEANRNLDAASAAYETLVKQLDKDRQIGATAIFRLGEVYRKQGRTNEAVVQYERIVRDFAEQTTLVTLSRQNLAGLGFSPKSTSRNASLPAARKALEYKVQAGDTLSQIVSSFQAAGVEVTAEDVLRANPGLDATKLRVGQTLLIPARDDAADVGVSARGNATGWSGGLGNFDLARLKKLSSSELLQVLLTITPDATLVKLSGQLSETETTLAKLNLSVGSGHPDYQTAVAVRSTLNSQINQRMNGILQALELRESDVNKRAGAVTTVVDEEEAEIRRIQGMIQNSPDLINAQSGDPIMTPLGRAASKGQLRVAGFLLDHGADLNLNLPLSQAAGGGHKAMVELLLKHGAPVNAATGSGETALQRAAQRGFVSVVEVLLNAKADPNLRDDTDRTALTLAAENNFALVAAALLARGANPNIICKTRKNWASDRTTCGAPIHFAITRTGDAMLALLLTNRAEVMLRNPLGETPLDMAASLGLTSKARQLIAAGAEVNPSGAANSGAAPPLYYAVSGGHREVAALLLEQGANPNFRILSGQEGVTPLMIAASKGDAEMVALLLKHKAEPNLADSRNNTALWNAINARSAKTVRALLAGGANPDTTSPNGSPVLMTAVGDARDSEMVAALIEAKANVKTTDAGAKTPLHYAVMVNRKDLVELLLAAGADANARDQAGKTPLDYTKPSPVQLRIPSAVLPNRASGFPGGANAPAEPVESKPADIAGLLRQHGALDELPDFTCIRITRQELAKPLAVFFKGSKLTNQFTLLESLIKFYNTPGVVANPGQPVQPAYQALPFPDFGRIIIRRPALKPGGKEQEIKVSLLNGRSVVDCAKDVPVQFGDVIEIPERVHALNDALDNPVEQLERRFKDGQTIVEKVNQLTADGLTREHPAMIKAANQKSDADAAACLRKSVQLVVAGNTTVLTVDSWKEGFLNQVLAKVDARAALRSSSDLSRVQVKRLDAKTGKPVLLNVDASAAPAETLWLRDGDVIEVPEKP